MLYYPDIDPVAISITQNINIHWYGLMYIIGFIIAWALMRHRTKHLPNWKNKDLQLDLFFYAAVGVLVGGKLGYVAFYGVPELISHPAKFMANWQRGMSFHGGLLGVVLGLWLFSKKKNLSFVFVTDLTAPCVPLALGCGRIGNFINGELWGTVTNVPWGMVFPHVDGFTRHPSQLYGVLLEGIVLFVAIWLYSRKPRIPGMVSGFFLTGYGLIRIIEEFFRQPDPQFGYLAFGWLTMGQLLCLPMLFFAGCFFWYACQHQKVPA